MNDGLVDAHVIGTLLLRREPFVCVLVNVLEQHRTVVVRVYFAIDYDNKMNQRTRETSLHESALRVTVVVNVNV